MSFIWMVSKRHVSTADEAIIFDLEDQGKPYQEVAIDLGSEEWVRAKEEIQNYVNKKEEQGQI